MHFSALYEISENCAQFGNQIKAFRREIQTPNDKGEKKDAWKVDMKSLFHLYFIHCALVVEADKTVVYVVAITKFV